MTFKNTILEFAIERCKVDLVVEPVILPRGFKLRTRGACPEWTYFPEDGIASVITQVGNVEQEAGLFGWDGVSSLSTAFGLNYSSSCTIMQVSGAGHRVNAAAFTRVVHSCPDLRGVLIHYVFSVLDQLSQTATANTQLNTAQRLARWLLMIRARMNTPRFDLTHEYLAFMLGTGRPGVTSALQVLREMEAICTGRGWIEVRNQSALRSMTRGL